MRNLFLRSFLRFGILLFLTVSFAGQTGDWKTYKNTDGNFTALFPGDPQDSVNAASGSGISSHTLMVQTKAGIYTVVYTTMEAAQTVDDATYETFKNAVFHELPKCDVDTERPPAPAIQGYIGHWYQLSCAMPSTKVAIKGNLYWGKHYAYAVMVMHAVSGGEPEGTEKFLDSFAVIGAAK